MYFKKLEMAGFKSFADKIEVNFDSGVTAIVGPNGCGKSNVADAIRWVLGEQSAKTLRGGSMQDVIFNGSEKRKSLSYCEVTLYFNNTDRFFNFPYDEIAITRKLYRSGESEYLMNKNQCRLKDIVNLLYDSGLGKDGYSIIGQGQVEKIISSKPEDRRTIFEDAAGISKFKSRKLETERKLERTRENLVRLRDIIIEIERQLGPLNKQAENARMYNTLRDQLRILEINAYIYQYENANSAKEKIYNKLKAIAEELSLRQEDLEQTNQKYATSMKEINDIDAEIEKLHAKILEVTVEIEKQVGETKVIRERIKNITEQNEKLKLNIINSKNIVSLTQKELDSRNALIAKQEEELSKYSKESESLSNEYLNVIDELNLSEGEAETSQKNMLDAMDKLTDIKANSSRLDAEQKTLIETLNQSIEKESELKERIKQDSQNIEIEKQKQQKIAKENEDMQTTLDEGEKRLNQARRKVEEAEQNIHDMQVKVQVFENRKRLLQEMQSEYEGYAGSVKRILRDSERNADLRNKFVGVVANMIKVPEKYETAIEMALGNAVQNIITENEDDSQDLISYLKKHEYGRVTFLPISSMRTRDLSFEYIRFTKEQGCFGIAKDLIQYDPKIENVMSNLLGSTVIVDTLYNAVKIAQNSRHGFKIVTLDGDIVSTQGSMTGGSKKTESLNLISRDREIATLTTEIDNKKNIISQQKSEIEKGKLQIKDVENKYQMLLNSKKQLEINLATQEEKVENLISKKELIENELAGVVQNSNRIENRINLITNELKSVDELENSVKTNKTTVNQGIAERQRKFAELKKKRDEYNIQITDLKVKIASLESNISSNKQDVDRMNSQIETTSQLQEKYEDELRNNEFIVSESEKRIAIEVENTTNIEAKNRLDSYKEKQSKLDARKVEVQNDVKNLDEMKTTLVEQINDINDRKFKEDLKISKVENEVSSMQTRIEEEYSLDYEGCKPYRQDDFQIHEATGQISGLKKDISKLGAINHNAIEESKILQERYEALTEQENDLIKADEDLNEIIKELADEMVVKFQTSFDKINDNFKRTFNELFGGGSARLELVGDDILEAGVEIVAEPPGKKLQSITLLSGGEKALTAIAILFAILKLRPMPFCLLDEIEAALDDANVERFAQYLHRFSETTQFIVITHRKPTMELADNLYGVTMEEKGVSKTVSVKLSDAIRQAEEEDKK